MDKKIEVSFDEINEFFDRYESKVAFIESGKENKMNSERINGLLNKWWAGEEISEHDRFDYYASRGEIYFGRRTEELSRVENYVSRLRESRKGFNSIQALVAIAKSMS